MAAFFIFSTFFSQIKENVDEGRGLRSYLHFKIKEMVSLRSLDDGRGQGKIFLHFFQSTDSIFFSQASKLSQKGDWRNLSYPVSNIDRSVFQYIQLPSLQHSSFKHGYAISMPFCCHREERSKCFPLDYLEKC